jgi:hypothetical protein
LTPKIIVVIFLGALAAVASYAASLDTGYHRPVAVETLSYVDVHSYHLGSAIYVKVKVPWEGVGCYLYDGEVLRGKVELATPRGKDQKESQLAISFPDVHCVGSKSTVNLVLVAVEWDQGLEKVPESKYPSVVQMATTRIGGNGAGMSAMTMMSLSDRATNQIPLMLGEVLGIDGLTLAIGKGPDRSSLLKSSKRDVHLEKDSLMMLMPDSIAFPKGHEADGAQMLEESSGAGASPAPPADADIVTKPLPIPPPVEFQDCKPPACTMELSSSDHETHGSPSKSIAIRPLGYAPRLQQEFGELNNDEALGWLGPQQLLIAFNPHTLIDRAGEISAGAAIRKIHAVVVDPATNNVLSSADWFLSDEGEFLWQLAGGRVLVHVGNELRIYGEGMQIERQIPLDGPLKFVRLSPNGEVMAIGIAQETHTVEQHAALRDSLGTDPPENVEIRVLDKDFKTVAQATTSSRVIPPTLLNEGQVQLLAETNKQHRLTNQYLLRLQSWTSETKTVARFPSGCVPDVSSFAPDLILVSSCERSTGAHEYRVLRPNGKVVLQGRPDPQEAGQSAQGTGRIFALKNLHSTQMMIGGNHFQGSDLDYEEVRVFQSNNGRRLTSLRLQAPPPCHGAFALSSDGKQLAVIADGKVNLFSVPAQ